MILADLLNVPLEDIHLMKLPYIGIGNSAERLRRIIYSCRRYLIDRLPTEIQHACADVLYLYQHFFTSQAEKLRDDIAKAEDQALHPYLDIEQYIDDYIKNLKLNYLSEVEVLNALIYTGENFALNQINGVKTDFSDFEFFSVLALYYSSIAFIKIFETKKIIDNGNINELQIMPAVIEQAYDAILEAQIAVDHARQLKNSSDPEFSDLIQDYIKDSRRLLSKKATEGRYSDKYQQRRFKAIELYKKGSFRTRFDAALHLIEPIQEFSKQLNVPQLKLENAQDTIYKWLSNYDNEKI